MIKQKHTVVEFSFRQEDVDGTVAQAGVPGPTVLPGEHAHGGPVLLPSATKTKHGRIIIFMNF